MKKVLASLGLVMLALGGVMTSTQVWAATDICSDPSMPKEMREAAGCSDFGADKPTAMPLALQLINVVSTFVGLLAVGVIVYGGILYASSVGDASKIHKAKNCILYGVVGLVVVILAFAIVAFVNASILKK